MRQFDLATAQALAGRSAYHMHALLWIEAKNRVTGALESIGFWTGDDNRVFTIGGVERTYLACGEALEVPPIVQRAGYVVQTQRLSLSGISPEAVQALRVYDPRFAPVEVRRAVFDPVTLDLVAEPHVMFLGAIDEVSLPTPAKGGTSRADLSLVSSARSGTQTLALRRSDEALRARTPADGFRRYIAVSNVVPVWWGELRAGQRDTSLIDAARESGFLTGLRL